MEQSDTSRQQKRHAGVTDDNDNATTAAAGAPPPTRRITSRNPQWTYLKLQLITQPLSRHVHLDALTARTHLSSALSQFLGLMGSSIAIDILKIEDESGVLWIRVPREDGAAVVAAVSSWIGSSSSSSSFTGNRNDEGEGGREGEEGAVAWRVLAKGNFLGGIVHGSGGDVFEP